MSYRKYIVCSAWLPPTIFPPPSHSPPPCISHVNSPQPTTSSPVSAPTLSLSLFTSNSPPSVLGNCVWWPRLGRFLQAWHFITAKDGTHGDLRSARSSHFRGPFASCGKKEKEIRAFYCLQLQNGHNLDDINLWHSGFFLPIMCHPCQFNIGAKPLMTPIILICTGTQLGVARPSVQQWRESALADSKRGNWTELAVGGGEVGSVPVQHGFQALCFSAKQCFGNVRILTVTCGFGDWH